MRKIKCTSSYRHNGKRENVKMQPNELQKIRAFNDCIFIWWPFSAMQFRNSTEFTVQFIVQQFRFWKAIEGEIRLSQTICVELKIELSSLIAEIHSTSLMAAIHKIIDSFNERSKIKTNILCMEMDLVWRMNYTDPHELKMVLSGKQMQSNYIYLHWIVSCQKWK